MEEAGKSGKVVIETDGLGKSYGAEPIVKDLSVKVARGDRIGVIGPNGIGKTTLVKLATSEPMKA